MRIELLRVCEKRLGLVFAKFQCGLGRVNRRVYQDHLAWYRESPRGRLLGPEIPTVALPL